MRPPEPVRVLDLLSGLSEGEWGRPTICAGWSVKDVAGHVLGGDRGNLSVRRDGFRGRRRYPARTRPCS